ncbi:MAG: biotin--[acetyl-CoA-carboxylase] ligase [Marinomonas foliarum]|jgi:BirA family transcriptional regulator, biotin operon repressor / biotin---[acetyl-CoA-carboxylase] ligase|uniref:Bifunctional ligase/repressor BirA n=1 Tax=Marinomonas foliarum TaxID=491950 RepID=A0A368ZXR5_9GAMM|nr:biotin--[acetyl-CoA-carboxylase] ligase [Marinomonas foliarum]QRV25513.1 biotin--[acetyl-CoA-carboxylase] ligase [Marinomonas foliarum]RCW99973.1 BirA family biotin operon repressor/biotin-[acetyl-CoA-carboxylase] ligase [Marinomonas foliarum]
MQAVLALLSDNEFHSGEELGVALGVTRAAVWKKLKKLESIGVTVHSVKGRGYRLPTPVELLSEELLRANGVASDVALKLAFETESTNGDAKQHISTGQPLPALIAVERQTKGKGRRGRQWESGVAKNLTFSFVWRFDNGPSVVEGLSLAVGVAVARVLRKAGIPNPGLKWPNDVQIDGQKICGILLEMVADQDVCHVIIGVGLNVEMDDGFMAHVDQPWTDLVSRLKTRPSRNFLLAELTEELMSICQLFEDGNGMKHFQHQWQAYDVLFNQSVTVSTVSQQRQGVARGIDQKGALLLEENGELVALHGGEISVRRI